MLIGPVLHWFGKKSRCAIHPYDSYWEQYLRCSQRLHLRSIVYICMLLDPFRRIHRIITYKWPHHTTTHRSWHKLDFYVKPGVCRMRPTCFSSLFRNAFSNIGKKDLLINEFSYTSLSINAYSFDSTSTCRAYFIETFLKHAGEATYSFCHTLSEVAWFTTNCTDQLLEYTFKV